MKQLSYLTGFLFASLAAIPASGQTTTNSFPKLWEKPTKTIMMAPPRRTPQAIDDKGNHHVCGTVGKSEQETRLDKVPHR